MQYVEELSSSIYEIKKSKFIAYLFPYPLFDTIMDKVKAEHPKARHYVYAYRYLNEFDQIIENSSDDGEPKGTSGKPSLTVLSGHDMINSGVIIVRYFGGIKLGTGGLVRAYSDAVNLVIENASLHLYQKTYKEELTFNYPSLSQVEYFLKKLNIIVDEKEFSDTVTLKISGTQESLEELKVVLKQENIVIKDK